MDFLLSDGTIHNALIAQIQDPDILGQIQSAWQEFIETGRVWALLVGVFFGYVFATFTRF